jgi:peroxiredoxin Q/BCP
MTNPRKKRFKLSLTLILIGLVGLGAYFFLTQPTEASDALLPIGSKAPSFSLPATFNQQISLSDYSGKNLILVFYPMDNTPGCTIQLCALQDQYEALQKENTEVLASNPGSLESHEKFAKNKAYPFPLLVDSKKEMARAYKALGQMGLIDRTVYIIGKDGRIRFAERGLPSVETLWEVIRDLNAASSATSR